jgi:hypothetical protein
LGGDVDAPGAHARLAHRTSGPMAGREPGLIVVVRIVVVRIVAVRIVAVRAR